MGRGYIVAGAVSFAWITLHFASVHAYTVYCTPLTVEGFFRSVFVAPAPYCQALRQCIRFGGDHITGMWTSFLTAAIVMATASATAAIVTKSSSSSPSSSEKEL